MYTELKWLTKVTEIRFLRMKNYVHVENKELEMSFSYPDSLLTLRSRL